MVNTIKNVSYLDASNGTTNTVISFFGTVNGTLKNVKISGVDADMTGVVSFSGLAAKLTGTGAAADGCVVENVTYDGSSATSGAAFSGMFIEVNLGGTVTDCDVSNVQVKLTGSTDSGIYKVAGHSGSNGEWAYFTDCTVTNFTVNADCYLSYTGGFAYATGTSAYYNNCDVNGFVLNGGKVSYIGGFTAYTQGGNGYDSKLEFNNCDVTGLDVDVTRSNIGGFVGNMYCRSTHYFNNCTTAGKISVDTCPYGVGGFLGYLYGRDLSVGIHTFTGCSADVDITAANTYAGGFAGNVKLHKTSYNSQIAFVDCSASGDVTASGAAGGFAGAAGLGSYTNCTATGTVTCEEGYAAGLIGLNLDESAVVITECTSTANYTGIVEDPVYNLEAIAAVNKTGYASIADAVAAAAAGDVITVLVDHAVDATVVIDKAVTIDLNGKTVTSAGDVFEVKAGATVTINGEGSVKGGTNGVGSWTAVWANGGDVVINGGTYSVGGDTSATDTTHQNDVIYTKNGGTVVINGGTFLNDGTVWTLNENDANRGTITVKGGTFQNWDPANNVSEGEGTDFVAEGYESIYNEADNTWTVSKIYNYVAQVDETKYESLAEAVAAANELGTATVTLLKDVTLGEKLTITGNVTIEGAYTITRAADYTGTLFSVPAEATLILKDVVVDGNNDWVFHEEEYKAQVMSGGRVSNSSVCYTTYEEGAPVATATVVSINGNVILDGATFQNHVGSTVFGVASGATLTMNDAVVTHNTKNGSSVVADVAAGGTWTINGETKITNNHNHAGNGTLSYMKGTTIMNGGEISGNTGVDNNGSVFMLYGGSAYFEMNGGIVADNWSLFGTHNGWNPAFYVYGNGATFVMNDGVIENNTSSTVPGIANNGTNGKIEINGGVIRNNDSTNDLNGADLYSYCPVTIEEGVVLTGTARFYGTVENNGTLEGGMYLGGSAVAGGTGTVTGVTCVFANTNVTITDGNYLGDLEVREGGSLTITGGRFADLEAIKYLAPGLGLFKNADGTYTVTDQVAEVGGVVYDSVAAAEAAVTEENTTITMLAIAPIRESVLVDQLTVLDLNNNDLYATVDDVYPMIRSLSDLTVKGEGLVDAVTFGTGYAFIVGSSDTAGELTIQGGNYYTSTTVASVTKGTLNVEGGYYEVSPYTDDNGVEYGYRYTLNCIDANYNDGSAVINVTGGTFYGYDPDNNLAEGEGTDFVPVTHISTEYEATEEGRENTWTVTPDYVCWNMQTGVYYMTVSAGLEEAVSGETVQLLKSTADNYVLV
ncbi:MAG: hypothetical protein IJX04_08610, partial [Oscillospiraceae bacterium]|nr:hypothetical protein [Oscillospiraceae bacterium]